MSEITMDFGNMSSGQRRARELTLAMFTQLADDGDERDADASALLSDIVNSVEHPGLAVAIVANVAIAVMRPLADHVGLDLAAALRRETARAAAEAEGEE